MENKTIIEVIEEAYFEKIKNQSKENIALFLGLKSEDIADNWQEVIQGSEG